MSNEMNIKLLNEISRRSKIVQPNIPKFRCQADSITATKANKRLTCRAYVLTVQRQHAAKLQSIMEKAFAQPSPDLAFIFFRQRRDQFEFFSKAVFQQATREENMRVVAVKGLHPDKMFHFESRLRKEYQEIEEVYTTPSTFHENSEKKLVGRYNLLCSKANFVPLAKKLSTDLASLYNKFLEEENETPQEGDEPVTVVSRFPGSNWWRDDTDLSESSLSTRDSFTSGCDSLWQDCALPWENETAPDKPPPRIVVRPSASPSPTDVSPITHGTSPTYAQVAATPPPVQPMESIDEVQQLKTHIQNLESRMEQQNQQLTQQNLQLAQMMNMFNAFLSQGSSSTAPFPAPSPDRKKTRTSSHDGGSAESSADDSDTPMDHEL
jgi:hypothetical protein